MSDFIESYSFGKILIDDKEYENDVILLNKKVVPDWWRKSGHSLCKDDLSAVLNFDPEILVVGTGASGNMNVPKSLLSALDFKVITQITRKAINTYNDLLKSSKHEKIAAGFHLTC